MFAGCVVFCVLVAVCATCTFLLMYITQMMKVEQNKQGVVAKGRRDAKSAMNRIKGRFVSSGLPQVMGIHCYIYMYIYGMCVSC